MKEHKHYYSIKPTYFGRTQKLKNDMFLKIIAPSFHKLTAPASRYYFLPSCGVQGFKIPRASPSHYFYLGIYRDFG